MANIVIEYKDGRIERFKEEQRAGGCYRNTLRYETGFIVITDVWGKETSIPSDDIKRIEQE